MESVRDTYARINPDSPWRWVPVVGGPLSFALMGVILATPGWDSVSVVTIAAAVVIIGLMIYARHKMGALESYGIVREGLREAGRNRVNSLPRLAVGMFVVGIALIATSIGAWFVETDGLERTPATLRFLRQMGCFGTGMMLAVNGWYRPWDLKVVERESARA